MTERGIGTSESSNKSSCTEIPNVSLHDNRKEGINHSIDSNYLYKEKVLRKANADQAVSDETPPEDIASLLGGTKCLELSDAGGIETVDSSDDNGSSIKSQFKKPTGQADTEQFGFTQNEGERCSTHTIEHDQHKSLKHSDILCPGGHDWSLGVAQRSESSQQVYNGSPDGYRVVTSHSKVCNGSPGGLTYSDRLVTSHSKVCNGSPGGLTYSDRLVTSHSKVCNGSPGGLTYSDRLVTSHSKYTGKKRLTDEDINTVRRSARLSWMVLAMLIYIDGITEMIEVAGQSEEMAEKKVLEYLTNGTLQDFVIWIDYVKLLASEIHWNCQVEYLKPISKSIKIEKNLDDIFFTCEYFSSFWFALLSVQFFYCTKFDKEKIAKAIKELENQSVMKYDKDCPDEELREINKFEHFKKNATLKNCALSVDWKHYIEVFSILSEFTEYNDEWNKYVSSIGLVPAVGRKPFGHYCTSYFLKKNFFCGSKVDFGTNIGTLGWPITINDFIVYLTSSHNIPNDEIIKKIKKSEPMVDLKVKCQIENTSTYVISGGYSTSKGAEIILVIHKNISVYSKHHMGTLYRKWKQFGFPDKIYFDGEYEEAKDILDKSDVYLLGQSSGLTKGILSDEKTTFVSNYPTSPKKSFFHSPKKESIVLENQLKVHWESKDNPFSQPGDSGGLVFKIDKKTGKMTAIGLLTGANVQGQYSYVSPIKGILELVEGKYKKAKLHNFELTLEKISLIV